MSVDELQLQHGFEQFVAAAKELERGYRDLKARVAAVDLELQQTNQALQQSLQEREAIFAALPIGLVTVRDGAITVCNREGERLCGLGAVADVDLARQGVGEVALGDGLVRIRRVDLPDGELVMLEDRSRVRELEREVDRLDRLAGLSELALGIAHEIKNPLNGVMGFAGLVERSKDLALSQRYAGKIVEGVRQVDRIVKSLLGFARPNRGQVHRATVGSVVADAIVAAGLSPRNVELRGDPDLLTDADALARVISNLLRNAVEARSDAHVTIDVEQGRGWLEIVVADDGPGVPAALGQKAMEPMVSTKERGSGLGLSLSSRVLAFLGGELRLLNPGQPGARFLIRIPVVEPRLAVAEAMA